MESIRAGLYDIVERQKPVTVRQAFYRAVVAGLVEKTEAEYKRTVCRLLADMRRAREIPYHWIADATRWMRKPVTFSSLGDMLDHSRRFYRRALWDDQDAYVEVWLEKEALAGVLVDVTNEWDVPLMVTRGYPSLSFLHAAAAQISSIEKPVHIYYFGDHDPSGRDISRFVEESLCEMAPDAEIHFVRLAVEPWQIEHYGLPTRPTKKSDSRSASFKGESVEVDAIDPDELREICQSSIESHIDHNLLDRTQVVEAAERQTLQCMIENLEGAA